MILKFSKNANHDVEVVILKGAENLPFSYTALIKSLLDKEEVKTEFTEEILENERQQIDSLIVDINNIVNPPNITE